MALTASSSTAQGVRSAPGARPAAAPALRKFLSLQDFETAARRHLPGPIYAYVSGGAEDNASLHDNRAAFAELGFVTSVLRNVSGRSQEVELLGRTCASPFGIAPMGISALFAYRGDLIMARAAAGANVPMIMAGSSLIPLESVVEAAPETWFQAYLPGETGKIEALVARVDRAGVGMLISAQFRPSIFIQI